RRDHQIVVINTEDEAYEGLVEHETWLDYELWGDRVLVSGDGVPIPYQRTQPGSMFGVPNLIFPISLPAGAAVTVLLRHGVGLDAASDLAVSKVRLANTRLAVDLTPAGIGGIAFDGRPLLGPLGMTLLLRSDRTDTWGMGTDRWIEPVTASLSGGVWEIEE